MKPITTAIIACMALLLAGCQETRDHSFMDANSDLDVSNYTLLEYFENDYPLYCQAIRLAGLEEVIEAGGVTCVVPNNAAFYAFRNALGVSSLTAVNPLLLRSLMLYMILPGDYRSPEMTRGESYRIESLAGDPIFIERNADTGRMWINADAQELAAGATATLQQDLLFKNQVVAQVVPSFVTFMPKVAKTEAIPESFVPTGETVTLPVSDCVSIWGTDAAGGNANYVTSSNAGRVGMQNESFGSYSWMVFKYPLTSISFKDNIAAAKVINRVFNITGYELNYPCVIEFRELHFSAWEETTVTWDIIKGPYNTPLDRAPVVAGNAEFLSRGIGNISTSNPFYIEADITGTLVKYYANDSTHLSLLVRDRTPDGMTSAYGFRLYENHVNVWPSTIELTGQFFSAMTLQWNNPVALTNGMATLHPDHHFAMTGPAVDNGYHYTDANIIYQVKSVPAGGILTLYGFPAVAGSRFTQAEMRAGVVKYFSTTDGADDFTLLSFDYLGGAGDELTITIGN